MTLLELSERQLALLVAHVACWRVANRAPRRNELRRLTGISSNFGALVTALIYRGLLTQDWSRGRRIAGSLRPTSAGLALIDQP